MDFTTGTSTISIVIISTSTTSKDKSDGSSFKAIDMDNNRHEHFFR